LEDIKNDYVKVEAELKASQQQLAESKKSMKKMTLKND
jgi:hypothetical protein